MSTQTATDTTFARAEDKRAARRAEERRQMGEAIAALRRSEGWQRWLRARRHFHTYSLHNQLLIALQCPEATRVAGFRRWLAGGYAVRRGERGIRIWAPCPPSAKRLRKWVEEGSDPTRRPRTHFRMVAVFDRSQVEPLPEFTGERIELDPPSEPLTGAALATQVEPLRSFAAWIGSSVELADTGAAAGFFEPKTGRIVVRPVGPEFSVNAQVATLIHELAHALIAAGRRAEDGTAKLSYAEEEVVVESVAYCVCASVGLDSGGASIPYLTSWSEGDVELSTLESHAKLIDELAKRLEAVVCDG